eukprot:scaffold31546_cov66-Phaeocystis_antarctica.AAC.2
MFFLSRLLYPGRTKVPKLDAMQPSPATENRIWSFSSFFAHQSGGRPLLEPMRHPSPPLLDAACRPAFGRALSERFDPGTWQEWDGRLQA